MIKKSKYFLLIALVSLCCCSGTNLTNTNSVSKQFHLLKLNMFLDAFGVESNGFPAINATINFVSDSGICNIAYYEPWLKQKQYSFSKAEIDTLRVLLKTADLTNITKSYKGEYTDQPTSTTTIYTSQDTFTIKDYGLQAKFPISELYRIVYNLKENFR